MAGLSPRIVLACALPTFLALISFAWFRKKKRQLPSPRSADPSEETDVRDNISHSSKTGVTGVGNCSDRVSSEDRDLNLSVDPEAETASDSTLNGSQTTFIPAEMQLKEVNSDNETKKTNEKNTQEDLCEKQSVQALNQVNIIEDTLCSEVKDKLNFGCSSSSTKKIKGLESENRCENESCTGGLIEEDMPISAEDNVCRSSASSVPVPQNKLPVVQQDLMQSSSSSHQDNYSVTNPQGDTENSDDRNSTDEKVIRTTVVFLNTGNSGSGSEGIQTYSVGEIAVLNSKDVLMNAATTNDSSANMQPDEDSEPLPVLVRDTEGSHSRPQFEAHSESEEINEESDKVMSDQLENSDQILPCSKEQTEGENEIESSVKAADEGNDHVGSCPFDSANNSLTDNVTESPGQSTYSDAQSEGSSDSGKGGSDSQIGSESSNIAYVEDGVALYEFELPQELCGRLIGKQGKHITFVKNQSNANVFLKRHPFTPDVKICAIEGSPAEINAALNLIRKRFPLSRYPSVTMLEVNAPISFTCIVPHALQLHLPEGVTCDVILSCLINAGHFFLQQPTHPTFTSLNRLDQEMNMVYSMSDPPPLPPNFSLGVICAAPQIGGWFRAAVVSIHENCEECDVKFMDYGGYATVPISSLRQIKHDFMTLPFQAKECYLANVCPVDEETGWSFEACATFEELAQGQILQALVVGYAEDGVPYVHLYRTQGASTVFINRDLASRGLAAWVDHQ